jgi:hypothetical protein
MNNKNSKKHDKNDSKKHRVANALYLSNVLKNSQWHSSMGFDSVIKSSQKNKDTLKNTSSNREQFIPAGFLNNKKKYAADMRGLGCPGELLIHKSTRALWKVSGDGRSIEPAFNDDIIVIGDDNE